MQRVRALATERGGHVSLRVFVNETGINAQSLRGQEWWTGWNSLLSEIGIKTREFAVPRTPEARIVEAVAGLIEREKRWPTQDDLRRERVRDCSFPSVKVIRPILKSGALAKLIVDLAAASGQFAEASLIARKHLPADESLVDAGPA